MNFPTIVYENPTVLVEELAAAMVKFAIRPEIEIFDLSHLHAAARLVELGLAPADCHVQFVMGVQNALPALERLLDCLLAEMRIALPRATWTAAGIGRHQEEVMGWSLERGAIAVRTGLEDNIRITRERLARSNAELVERAVEAIGRAGRKPAPAREARRLLGLPLAADAAT